MANTYIFIILLRNQKSHHFYPCQTTFPLLHQLTKNLSTPRKQSAFQYFTSTNSPTHSTSALHPQSNTFNVGILKLRITGHAKPSDISTGPRQMLHSHLNQPNYNFLKALSLPFLPHNLVLFILPCVMSTHKNIFMLFTSINLLFYSKFYKVLLKASQ
jgi:hypothetical protein